MSIVAERVTFNPIDEDPTLQSLDVVGLDPSWGIYLLAHDYPPPKPEVQRASNADSEGDPVVQARYPNRTISLRLRLFEPSDPEAINLIPNPSVETNTTGYAYTTTGWSEGAMTRVQSPFYGSGGDYALRLTAKKDATATLRTATLTINTPVGSVLAGEYISISVPVKVTDNAAKGIQVYVNYYTAGSVLISSSAATVAYTENGEMRIVNPERLAPATCSFVQLVVQFTSETASDTVDFLVDSIQIERGKSVTSYFDGDTPGCDWTGTRHGSTSTRPAPDGTRFSRIYGDVMGQLDRIKREKYGFLRRKAPGFKSLVFDLLASEVTDAPQDIAIGMKRAEVALAFEAKPGGRAAEVQIGGNFDELALPALSFLAEGVPGDMPALGRLAITDLQGQAQLAAYWGEQQRYYSSSPNAALFYEAETRTPLGTTSATAALAGASGAGNNTIRQTNLINAYQGVMSTQASGGGAHLSHVGSYRVLARMYRPNTNTGEVTVKFTWTEGDFVNVNENDEVKFGLEDREELFTLEDLGVVTIDQAPAGATQRWEGRILAKSTVTSDDLYVDCIFLIPTDEGSGEALASAALQTSTSLVGYDPFDQTAGALAGKAAPVGGNWALAGDPVGFNVNATTHVIERSEISDVENEPNLALCGLAEPTDIAVKVTVTAPGAAAAPGGRRYGVFARYVGVKNHLRGWISPTNTTGTSWRWGVGTGSLEFAGGNLFALGNLSNIPLELVLMASAAGEWRFYLNGALLGLGFEKALATGEARAKGRFGIADEHANGNAAIRIYDNFEAWVPTFDQAIFGNRTLEIDSDRVRRESSDGTTWGAPPYEGNYLLVPQAGPEKRVTRFIVKGSRNPKIDSGIDDIRGKLFVTPRYLEAPPN